MKISGHYQQARRIVCSGVALAVASTAAGQVALPFSPITPEPYGWSRADANSTYYEWAEFGSPFFSTTNFPDVAQFPAPLPAGWPDFEAGELTGSAILAASGNIYSLGGQAYFRFDFPVVPTSEVVAPIEREPLGLQLTPGELYTTVVIQVRTLGFEIERGTNVVTDTDTQQLPITSANPIADNWPVPGELPLEDTEVYRLDLPDVQFFGDTVDVRFVYEIAGAPTELFWLTTAPQHTSIDQLVIDTHVAVVPAADCPGDTGGDGQVNTGDLLVILANFGSTTATGPADGDVDGSGDGQVNTGDLLVVLARFGVTCS